MIKDKNINWTRKRVYIGCNQFNGWKASEFLGSGAVDFEEVSTFAIGGARLELTTDQVADCRPLPVDFDIKHPLYIRVYWSSDYSSTDGTALFRIRYIGIADGEVLEAPSTMGLDTVITADTSGGSYFLHKSSWGKINEGTFDDGDFFIMEIICTAVANITINSDYVFVHGYELEYTPKKTSDEVGMQVEAPRAYAA